MECPLLDLELLNCFSTWHGRGSMQAANRQQPCFIFLMGLSSELIGRQTRKWWGQYHFLEHWTSTPLTASCLQLHCFFLPRLSLLDSCWSDFHSSFFSFVCVNGSTRMSSYLHIYVLYPHLDRPPAQRCGCSWEVLMVVVCLINTHFIKLTL